jgi:hypothetical protein
MLNVRRFSEGARGSDAQAAKHAMWTYCFFHKGPLCP